MKTIYLTLFLSLITVMHASNPDDSTYPTAERLFHGKNNIKDHMEAFGIVTDAAMDSSEGFRAMAAKYSPNRAERRAEQKSQRHNTKSFQDFKGNPYVKGKQKNPYHGKSMNPVNQ